MRFAVQFLALLLCMALAFLTLYKLFTTGPRPLVLLSLFVVVVFGIGVFGALGDRGRRGGPL